MIIKTAQFLTSSAIVEQCPKRKLPEFAFIGRSNVGKSSLINLLTNHNKLAKISGTPGKTQTINHFVINDAWFLVDLPGYGFAKLSKKARVDLENMIHSYVLKRENLACLFVLIDSRHKPQAIDIDFIRWLGEHEIPFALIMTKTDKIKKQELIENIEAFQNKMFEEWEELPVFFYSSAVSKQGREEILDYIESIYNIL
ncbi:MAG: ribosome biogenesis GTP-binding protein YihA/YsxC [Bacteroidales bacterium]|jgi:GTP-binding protein|nr:ribosome biogenesis GTP-binding protein YihA/YsxC [Bacteroidales bacterium]